MAGIQVKRKINTVFLCAFVQLADNMCSCSVVEEVNAVGDGGSGDGN